MELRRFRLEVEKHGELRIRAFGDLQKGDPGFAADLWERFLSEAIHDKDGYLLGMGDFSNWLRPTMQVRLKESLQHDPEAHDELDTMVVKEMDEMAKEFHPLRKRILGLLEGHHFWKFNSGLTSTQYLCQKLEIPYLGFFCGLQLSINLKSVGKHGIMTEIIATHGCGGGTSRISSDVMKLERIMSCWNVDAVFRGHSTTLFAGEMSPLYSFTRNSDDLPKIVTKKRIILNTGGFMRGYVPGKTGYVEQANMPPSPLGWTILTIKYCQCGDRREDGKTIRRCPHLEFSGQVVSP